MGKSLFAWITRQAIQFRAITLSIAAIVTVLGIVAVTQLKQELLPSIAFPQTYILTEVNGMTPNEALEIVTIPLEQELQQIGEIVNLQSTTTGIFSVVVALNNFGDDQDAVQQEILAAIDRVNQGLPFRQIAPSNNENPQAFARRLLAELSPEVLAYIANENDGFLFQLDADVLRQFSDQALGIIPQEVIDELSPDLAGELSGRAEDTAVEISDTPPALPSSWQAEHFETAQDLVELSSSFRSLASIFNDFYETGRIIGPLGTTADLTPEVVTQVLSAAPSMIDHFQGQHLATMSQEVLAVFPEEYLANLDSLTKNEIAAANVARQFGDLVPADLPSAWRAQPPQMATFSLSDIPLASASVSGDQTHDELRSIVENIVIPRLEELDTVGTVSISGGQQLPDDLAAAAVTTESNTSEAISESSSQAIEVPEGPALPSEWGTLGLFLGVPINTADDLFNLQIAAEALGGNSSDLPEECAEQTQGLGSFGEQALNPTDILNFLPLLPSLANNPCVPVPPIAQPLLAAAPNYIRVLTPEVIAFFLEYDPDFPTGLASNVYDFFSGDVLALQDANGSYPMAPSLGQAWGSVATRLGITSFNASDLVNLSGGHVADSLNDLVEASDADNSGYEVNLINAITPAVVRFFQGVQPDFLTALSPDVLRKMSAETLAALPDTFWDQTDSTLVVELQAIANGEEPSAASAIVAQQQSDSEGNGDRDPDAPLLSAAWEPVAAFVTYELDSIDDLLRTPAGSAAAFLNGFLDFPDFAPSLLGSLTPEMVSYLEERETTFLNDLEPAVLALMPEETLTTLPEDIQARASQADARFVPENTITRLNGQPSLNLVVIKTGEANTVSAFHQVEDVLQDISQEEGITTGFAFEQASFIEEAISGVVREGVLGAVFAVVVILVFLASVRSTIVTAVSIPLSVLMALALMYWIPPFMHGLIAPLKANASGLLESLIAFALRLFPESITLNIMTLSGLTVAVGRVVDDSIVVLENIFRQIQRGVNQKEAVINGAREVSVAIFSATVMTAAVFLPLGLVGGIIGEFFLPFGLAVTYALMSSYIVAITVVPLLAMFFINKDNLPEEKEGVLERIYTPALRWALSGITPKLIVLGAAAVTLFLGIVLFASRPQAFLPELGDPQVSVSVNLPGGTSILETNTQVASFEDALRNGNLADAFETVQVEVGGGGLSLESFIGGSSISENSATITLGVHSAEELDALTGEVRTLAEEIFGGPDNVTVSSASLSEQGFGGFALVVSGPAETLAENNEAIKQRLLNVEGLANVSSSLEAFSATGGGSDASAQILRIDGQSAVEYSGELETENTLQAARDAKDLVSEFLVEQGLADNVSVSEGFETQQQTEGFRQMFVAIQIALAVVFVLLVLTFGSLLHPFDLLLSIVVAPMGAAVALTLTNSVLGISALIGLLMLVGIVVTNAVVLIDRVLQNKREHGMDTHEALIEGGRTRLRPILMTALATIFALLPLAAGGEGGAIIAAELGTVVIGGLFSSTVLTLLVVPVAFSLIDQLQSRLLRAIKRSEKPSAQ